MIKKPGKIIISAILVTISYGFVFFKLLKFEELKELSSSQISFWDKSFYLLYIPFALMFLNWCIEAYKWRLLMRNIQAFSLRNSVKAVFSGLSIGIFTPNRVGEIAGRISFLNKGKRTYGFLATSLGSFAQFITTIITGLIGLELFLIFYPNKANINPVFNKVFAFTILVFLILLIWTYFNAKSIRPWLLKIRFFNSRKDQLDYFSKTNFKVLFTVLFLSLSRYIVFFIQFFLLLLFFEIKLNLSQAFIAISLIYLFATLIPTTTLVELGIRGSLAIFFIGMFSDNYFGIVLSTIFLWIINLAIPSIIGSVFFIKNNL